MKRADIAANKFIDLVIRAAALRPYQVFNGPKGALGRNPCVQN